LGVNGAGVGTEEAKQFCLFDSHLFLRYRREASPSGSATDCTHVKLISQVLAHATDVSNVLLEKQAIDIDYMMAMMMMTIV